MTTLDDLRDAWQRLPDERRKLYTALILGDAGISQKPKRERHAAYTPEQITAMRSRAAILVSESPSMPNSEIAERLNMPLSTYKRLGIHKFIRQCFTTAPQFASRGYGGESASDESELPDDEN